MQCEWARHVERHTKKPVLILAPLAVSRQTICEAEKILGMSVEGADAQDGVKDHGVFITNYQKLHKFDPESFGGIVLDESSIVKHEEGKIRNTILESFKHTPFRLACTATPAPNDFMELGNHAEFMGSMSMSEMLSMFFVHDGGETQKWRLKGHAKADFWRWLASWCVAIQHPRDLGFEQEGYDLPPLDIKEVIVKSNMVPEGEFFAMNAATLQERRTARRDSINERVDEAAKLANSNDEQWAIWCGLNNESEMASKAIRGAIQVTGSDSDEHKEKTMLDFAAGKIRVIVSKPSICGYGMNFQSCHNTAFVGLSDSWEQYYQAIRRFWRFGQKSPVNVRVIISESEGAVLANINRKERDAAEMQKSLVHHMATITKGEISGAKRNFIEYQPTQQIIIPPWLKSQQK